MFPTDLEEEVPKEIFDIPDFSETPPNEEEEPSVLDKSIDPQIIEIQRSYNIESALIHYDSLTFSMKKAIQTCGLDLSGAIKRCEIIHGAGKCEAVTPTFVGPKCPQYFTRVGCC